MRVLGIDPGTTKSGWAIWDTDEQKIVRMGIDENQHIIDLIWNGDVDVHFAIIEEVRSYGMSVGFETFQTCWWSGRFYESISNVLDGSTVMFPRQEVKMYLLGTAKAKDADLNAKLREMYGEKGTKNNPGVFYGVKSHIWSALALIFAWIRKQDAAEFKFMPKKTDVAMPESKDDGIGEQEVK